MLGRKVFLLIILDLSACITGHYFRFMFAARRKRDTYPPPPKLLKHKLAIEVQNGIYEQIQLLLKMDNHA